ncbi:glutathione S-transferase T3-like [Zea mays]|uniref:glutathione S-transferase T3-like n=1 Tax=Zea mays TaxID=4577 RepID=UPI0004DEB86C|nr:glutathione S-transferase T3-like [Zea mays]|eukprot:XP_020405007.2 glutathione S-transferase T3-like [Zea mays]
MQTALPMDPVGGESMTQDDSAMATQNPSATGLEFEEVLTMQGGYFSNLMSEGNNNMSLDDYDIVSEQHPSVVVTSSRPNQKRSANFSQQEDALVVSAWLNISLDPVNGTNQTRGTFWKRVYNYYHNHKTFPSYRSQSSISHRWGFILESVNKFCACISDIEGRRQSGVTLQDKIVQAMALYKSRDKDNKSFQCMHCWNILRNQPKWHEKRKLMDDLKKVANKKHKTNIVSSPGTITPIINESSNSNPINDNSRPEEETPKRPIGIKKSKEVMRRGGAESYMEASKHFWDKKKECDAEKEKKKEERFNMAYEIEKERLQLDQVRASTEQMRAATEQVRAANEAKNLEVKNSELQMKKMLEEERIMTMELDTMPEHLQQFYRNLQNEIIARRVYK